MVDSRTTLKESVVGDRSWGSHPINLGRVGLMEPLGRPWESRFGKSFSVQSASGSDARFMDRKDRTVQGRL
ncbi:hypothetical protein VIGAN_06018600 [Vigna angularis var. angularis]|uniref:Uncharacterized protein n=1 Tax=Vigna angularis var. angularis TaxID=157739 RepID=A0A0S3S8V1_PHAAN|nr:hypothetical protein VIGAN_06018600 [Vigna angularis var. angularis]